MHGTFQICSLMSSAMCDLIHLLYSVTAAISLIQLIDKTLQKIQNVTPLDLDKR